MRWQLETYISGGNVFWNSWKQMSQSQPSIKRSSKVLCATTQKIDLCRIHHQECVIWATFPPMDALWSVAKVSKALFPDKVCKTMAGVSKCPREQKFCFQQVRNYRFPSWDQKAGRKSSVYFWFDLNKKCSAIIETHTLVNVVLVFIFALELWLLCPFLEGSQKFTLIVTIKQRCTWNTWQSSHLFCKHLHW